MKRIKTKEEFNGQTPSNWVSCGSMDYLYGKILPEDFNGGFDGWSINKANIVDCTPYKDIPSNVKEGDKFIIVSDKRLSGTSYADYFATEGLKIGDIVILSNNDGSKTPYFKKINCQKNNPINWGCLAPYPSIVMSNTKFKVGDKVNLKKPDLSGESYKGFTIVTMDANGEKMTIYSKEWDDNNNGHRGAERDLGTLTGRKRGHWNVNECEIELADSTNSVTTQVSERYPSEERPNEKVGSKHIVVISDGDFEVGEIVTLTNNDGTSCPKFSNGDVTTYCDWSQLAPAPYDADALFENKAYPNEKIGTKYKLVDSSGTGLEPWTILTLVHNDKTGCPQFEAHGKTEYLMWYRMARINNTETILNTQQHGSKISKSTDPTESFLCGISITYSTGSSPVGVAVCYSREEILVGS